MNGQQNKKIFLMLLHIKVTYKPQLNLKSRIVGLNDNCIILLIIVYLFLCYQLLSFNFPDNSSPKKPPRPISAVPSEYSDVSTSSCRTSDDGVDIILDDNKNNNNNLSSNLAAKISQTNTHEIDEPVTVSIVVSSPAVSIPPEIAPQLVRWL